MGRSGGGGQYSWAKLFRKGDQREQIWRQDSAETTPGTMDGTLAATQDSPEQVQDSGKVSKALTSGAKLEVLPKAVNKVNNYVTLLKNQNQCKKTQNYAEQNIKLLNNESISVIDCPSAPLSNGFAQQWDWEICLKRKRKTKGLPATRLTSAF